MENLRYMLSQYNPKTALLFGHRFLLNPEKNGALPLNEEGYMAGDNFYQNTCHDISFIINSNLSFLGGGYILTRKAVIKFVKL